MAFWNQPWKFPRPKPLELRKVIQRLRDYGIVYATGKGRHPKFYDPDTKKSYPVKSHGKKTLILSYALEDMIKKFDLPQTSLIDDIRSRAKLCFLFRARLLVVRFSAHPAILVFSCAFYSTATLH